MTLAKIVVSGKVTKSPEKRFTQNNAPITSFVMDINPQDETIVRVVAVGNLAEKVAGELSVGDGVIVDGRPQIEVVKTTAGKDKRVIEINASAVEKLGAAPSGASSAPSSAAKPAAKAQNIVQFADEDLMDEPIDEDEIPF
jgi:single-stranded DNA-binding protein